MHPTTTTDRNPHLDPRERTLDLALDRLGSAEHAGAPESLDDAILRATRPLIGAAPTRASVVARILGITPGMRLAAGIALAIGAGVIATVALRSTSTTNARLADAAATLDAVLAESTAAPASTTSLVLGDALIDVRASFAAAEESLDDFWAIPDDTDPLATELETSL
jgi:hypothetical protein